MNKAQFIKTYGKEPSANELKQVQNHRIKKLFTREEWANLRNMKVNGKKRFIPYSKAAVKKQGKPL